MSEISIYGTRTRKTMIARSQWGEFEYKTAGGYTVAAVIQYTRDGKLVREVVAPGFSFDSVTRRAKGILRERRPGTLPSDYSYLMEVVHLVEATAPAIRKYFGRHGLAITQVFVPGEGWQDANYHSGRSIIRKLADQGVTGIMVSRPLGRNQGRQEVDFTMTELLKSMNSRKARA